MRARRPGPHAISAMLMAAAIVASCQQATPPPSGAATSPAAASAVPSAAPSVPAATPSPIAAASLAPSPTPTLPPPADGYPVGLPLGYRADTWLRVLGAADDAAGTSVVALDDDFAVTVGFAPGSTSEVGVVRFDGTGRVVGSTRYTSDRDRSRSLYATYGGSTIWAKAINAAGDRLSLAFDDVWLPDVGVATSVSGWQVALPGIPARGIMLTDLVRTADATYLRGVVGAADETHLAILRVTPAGIVDWAFEYPGVREPQWMSYPGVGPRTGGKLFLTDDGRLLTAGYVRSQGGQERAVVLWLGSDGTPVRTVTVRMDPYRLHARAPAANNRSYQDLSLLPDGDVVLVSDMEVCSVTCHDGGALITRLSSTGAHRWTIGLHALDDIGGVTFVSEVRQVGDRLVLVGGSTAYESPENDASHVNLMMASLDASGRPVWIRSLGPPKVSSSSNEFKTDFANALLPVGDGRMIVTGASDSFGSHQVYDGSPYLAHRDLVLGMAGLDNGGIRGAGHLLWSPDLGNEYEVWAEEKAVTLATCGVCSKRRIQDVSLVPVTFAAEDLALVERDLDGGMPADMRGLRLTFGDGGREVTSSQPFLAEGDQVATDPDRDGIDQAWEDLALEQLKPVIELDDQETWLDERDEHYVAHLVRVSPYPSIDRPDYIVLAYAVSWSKDYGGADTFEVHRGDIELASLAYRVRNERSLRLEWVYTSAHGSTNSHSGVWSADDPTCDRASIADTGYLTIGDAETVGTELMCAALVMSGNRVKLQASQDKHALYPNKDVCEHHATLVALAGGAIWGEDCGGGGDWLFDAYNIGEPEGTLLVDDLGNSSDWVGLTEVQEEALVQMFPNERVLEGNRDKPGQFCGGLLSPPDACCGTTVANKVGFPLPPIMAAKLGPPTYRVSIRTASGSFAGTDAGVYVTLYGTDGRSFRAELDGSFERGSVDVFRIGDPSTYLGDIARIGLERDDDHPNPDFAIDLYGFFDLTGLDPTPDWTPAEARVEDLVTGRAWTFTIGQDLTDSAVHTFTPDADE